MLNYITWDVSPFIYEGEHFAIWWWAVFPFLGTVAFYVSTLLLFRYEKKPMNHAYICFLMCCFFAWFFAHVFRCIFYEWYELPQEVNVCGWGIINHHINPTLTEPSFLLRLNNGLSSQGIDFGVFVGALLCARILPYNVLWITDRMIAGRLAFHAIARFEFFFMSMVYGYETTLPFGMVFVLTGNPNPVHPTFLYEIGFASLSLLIWWLCYRRWKGIPSGLLTAISLLLFYVTRFFISFFKQEHMPFEHDWPIHMEQYLCIPYIIVAIWIICVVMKNKKKPC